MGKGTPFMDAAVRAYAEDVIERAQRNIGATRTIRGKRRRRVSSGNLQRSLTYFMSQNQFKYVLDFTTDASALSYAKVIEDGRRPGARMPPSSAILAWMNQKNIRLQKKGGGFIKETPALRKSVAFLIARSIGEKGIEGIHYYRDAIEVTGEEYAEQFREALTKEVQNRISLT
jgi:hypothetical protein